MLFLVGSMVLILMLAGVIVGYVAYPLRGQPLPGTRRWSGVSRKEDTESGACVDREPSRS